MTETALTAAHILEALNSISGEPSDDRMNGQFAIVNNGELVSVRELMTALAGGTAEEPEETIVPAIRNLNFPIVEIARFSSALTLIRLWKDYVLKETEVRKISEDKPEVIARYQPLFTQDSLDESSLVELESFLYFRNNRHWPGFEWWKDSLFSDTALLIDNLRLLLDEEEPIEERWMGVRKSALKGMGEGLMTAILQVAHPELYGILNKPAREALKRLGIWPEIRYGASPGLQYRAVNEVLKALSKALETDLWTLDSLLWRLADVRYWAVAPGEGAQYWKQVWMKNGICSIGYPELIDVFSELVATEDIDGIKDILRSTADGRTGDPRYDYIRNTHALGAQAPQLFRFFREVEEGHLVFANQGKTAILGIGIVTSAPILDTDLDYPFTREITWLKYPSPTQIPPALKGKFGKTVIELSQEECHLLLQNQVRYWTLSPSVGYDSNNWLDRELKYWDGFLQSESVGIGWNRLVEDHGDTLLSLEKKDDFKHLFKQTYGNNMAPEMPWTFLHELKEGDVILANRGA
ncbi:MAG TPA: hypothetical protein HA263_08835, partial [Methanoregulaceae archaeon]|nr:hypothetical protein [Methanoregulaceae archaeon]